MAISLNLAFLRKYANDGYESKNMDMRRFSVDNYLIDSCAAVDSDLSGSVSVFTYPILRSVSASGPGSE